MPAARLESEPPAQLALGIASRLIEEKQALHALEQQLGGATLDAAKSAGAERLKTLLQQITDGQRRVSQVRALEEAERLRPGRSLCGPTRAAAEVACRLDATL
jgi:hypothetical protein